MKKALTWLLNHDEDTPFECWDCPFAFPSYERTNKEYQRPNPSDPGEGYYDCRLLNRLEVWGEDPFCERSNWREKAQEEIE